VVACSGFTGFCDELYNSSCTALHESFAVWGTSCICCTLDSGPGPGMMEDHPLNNIR
jgi:hypothetical protein